MKTLFDNVRHTAVMLMPKSPDSKAAGRKQRREPGPRRREIEAEHRAALSRAYAFQAQRARSAEELAALDAQYQQRMEEGPDFTQYRSKSQFGAAPPHRQDRNAIVRLRYTFNSMARGAWKQRQKGKHRGIITRTCKDVFNALLTLAETYDRLFPSLECIGRMAQCCKQSVVTALKVLEGLGFITRHRRLRMVETALGRKAEQDTNGYELHLPRSSWGALAVALFTTKSESKSWSATDTEIYQYLKAHPETWGGSDAHGVACGGPPLAAHV